MQLVGCVVFVSLVVGWCFWGCLFLFSCGGGVFIVLFGGVGLCGFSMF